jgi:hypothetical protein
VPSREIFVSISISESISVPLKMGREGFSRILSEHEGDERMTARGFDRTWSLNKDRDKDRDCGGLNGMSI